MMLRTRRLFTPKPLWATIRDALRLTDDRIGNDFVDTLFATPVRQSNTPLAIRTARKLVAKYESEMKTFGSQRMRGWQWTPAQRRSIADELLAVVWTLEAPRNRIKVKCEIAVIEASYKVNPSHWPEIERIVEYPVNEWFMKLACYEALRDPILSVIDRSRLIRAINACERRTHAVIRPGTAIEP